MTAVGKLYKELVYGGHLLAFGTASIAATAALVLGRTPTWDLLLMAYLFSYGAYMVNRSSDFDQDRVSHLDRTAYLEGRRRSLPMIVAVSLGVGYVLALLRNLTLFAGLLVPVALAVAYSVGSKRMGKALGMSRLKEGLFVKNLTVSFGWSLIPILVGLYYMQLPLTVIALCPFIFLRLMVNTVFFDVRDVKEDAAYGVRTIPVSLGTDASWKLMDVVDFSSGLYIALLVLSGVLPTFAGLLVVFTPYSFAYRYFSRRSTKHEDSLRDLAADGEYLLWGFVAYLGLM
ncbi:MAG: UbiA family prenyltransferase [Nitrososphaerales archaeon]|jgi:4-hydroxybenzoate polyprenyltransferase